MKNLTMNVYEIIMESGDSVYKVVVPAFNEKDACDFVQGNGEIVRIKLSEVYNDINKISNDKFIDALRLSQFGEMEINILSRALSQLNLIG
ncbi:MAG TPA: hypothetical protein VJ845_00550 [Haploplasma sp.]|nr:hypothetical protein [Haploplasma sp.]